MKYILALLTVLLLVVGCSAPESAPTDDVAEEPEVNEETMPEENEEVEMKDAGEWCEPGATYSTSQQDATVDAKIMGMSEYDGKELCKGEHTQTISQAGIEMTIETTYYFNEGGSEVYAVVNTAGVETVVHTVDGEIVN